MLSATVKNTIPACLSVVCGVICLFSVSANVPLTNHTPLSTDQRVLHLERSIQYIMWDLRSPGSPADPVSTEGL